MFTGEFQFFSEQWFFIKPGHAKAMDTLPSKQHLCKRQIYNEAYRKATSAHIWQNRVYIALNEIQIDRTCASTARLALKQIIKNSTIFIKMLMSILLHWL